MILHIASARYVETANDTECRICEGEVRRGELLVLVSVVDSNPVFGVEWASFSVCHACVVRLARPAEIVAA